MPQNQLRVSRTSEEEQTRVNRQDHVVTTDLLTLGTMLEESKHTTEASTKALDYSTEQGRII